MLPGPDQAPDKVHGPNQTVYLAPGMMMVRRPAILFGTLHHAGRHEACLVAAFKEMKRAMENSGNNMVSMWTMLSDLATIKAQIQ